MPIQEKKHVRREQSHNKAVLLDKRDKSVPCKCLDHRISDIRMTWQQGFEHTGVQVLLIMILIMREIAILARYSATYQNA